MDQHLISYFVGIFIVFATHIYLLSKSRLQAHSVINILAGLLIAYYFMNKEKYIKF